MVIKPCVFSYMDSSINCSNSFLLIMKKKQIGWALAIVGVMTIIGLLSLVFGLWATLACFGAVAFFLGYIRLTVYLIKNI